MISMRFHALGVQHTVTSKEYIACAFTQKVLKFCSMMTLRGHTVIHYGHEDSDVECTEHVNVLSRDVYDKVYGEHDFRSKLFRYDLSDEAYTTFNENAIREINARKQPGDFLLAFWGAGHKAICDGAGEGLKVVEPGIGYPYGHFADYKIFESYSVYHAFTGIPRVAHCVDLDLWSKEAVIPNYFDVSDFVDDVVPTKDRGDYFLFVGRIGTAKGLDHAIRMTEQLGVRLVVAGQNAEEGLKEIQMAPPPKHVEVIGHVDVEKRKTLMANAKAVVCMSMFAEPFCGVHVEAMMSGTPVITGDWGAFTECNVHGVTGFRCRNLDQMIEAGRRIGEIDPHACRTWAMDKFSTDRVADMYEAFFDGKMYTPTKRPKIAVWNETKWAMGRIGRAIQKYHGNCDVYDWCDPKDNTVLWVNGKWKEYDWIISNTTLFSIKERYGVDPDPSKLFVVAHCPVLNDMSYFKETIDGYTNDYTCAGVSHETCAAMRNQGVKHPAYVPFGADTDVFPWTHRVTGPIRRLGIIGRTDHEEYARVKGMDMFREICRRAGFEPVYIHGRDDALYTNIDALICCSEFEGGPLGVFEAASCGVPVLTRPVGNARYIKGIETFETADDALRILDIWNGDVDRLRRYAESVTREVRINWSMRTLLNKYLFPAIDRTLDFIEIGTSDFDTEIQKANGRRGISVEPLRRYLDALPDVEGVTKVCAAVSNVSGTTDMYTLKSVEGLPDWVRGCNSFGDYHPTVLKLVGGDRERFTIERVPVLTFAEIVKGYRSCKFLKIDTEGHDPIILHSYLDCVDAGRFELIPRIRFEANGLAPVDDILKRLETYGYRVKTRTEYDIEVVK